MNTQYADTLDEAKTRYLRYYSVDPFPNIAPALLNSGDIMDYVRQTGMICPFYQSELNPVSYAISILGDYIYWVDGEKTVGQLRRGETITLKSNSIAFVSLEPYFQLPFYIAARFNFKINNIYRGLLLGTGPVVDPGFCGRLSVPVHNLTTNDYVIRGGETFIWMEFTKISVSKEWATKVGTIERIGHYKKFNETKKDKKLQEYIFEAEAQRPIQSSIPDAISKAAAAAESAKRTTTIYAIASYAVLLTCITIALLIFYNSNAFLRSMSSDLDQKYEKQFERLNESLMLARHDIDSLRIALKRKQEGRDGR